MPSTTTKLAAKHIQRMVDRHASLGEAYRTAFAAVETFEPSEGSSKKDAAQQLKDLEFARDEAAEKLKGQADRLREKGFTLANDDSDPVAPAPVEVEPVPLAKVKKADTVHIFRQGRKGYLVADQCRVVDDGKGLAFKCRWHKDEVTIPLNDLSGMTVKRDREYVPVALP